jgi:transposase InsO family protein
MPAPKILNKFAEPFAFGAYPGYAPLNEALKRVGFSVEKGGSAANPRQSSITPIAVANTSYAFGKRCREIDVMPPMGAVGDAYDNAMAESFWRGSAIILAGLRSSRSRRWHRACHPSCDEYLLVRVQTRVHAWGSGR